MKSTDLRILANEIPHCFATTIPALENRFERSKKPIPRYPLLSNSQPEDAGTANVQYAGLCGEAIENAGAGQTTSRVPNE